MQNRKRRKSQRRTERRRRSGRGGERERGRRRGHVGARAPADRGAPSPSTLNAQAATLNDTSGPVLVLTGEQQGQEWKIEIAGEPLWLSCGLFEALCELADARLNGESPEVAIGKMTVHRLKDAINRATGREGFGESILCPAPVGRGKYVLLLEREQIEVHPSFRHVLLADFIDRALAERLVAWSQRP